MRREWGGEMWLREWVNPKCCGEPLTVEKLAVSTFPYIHVDVHAYCRRCNRRYIFGVPLDHHAGMALHLFGEAGPDDIRRAQARFTCPFCGAEMKLTKLLREGGRTWAQYKCPKCYLAYHRWV